MRVLFILFSVVLATEAARLEIDKYQTREGDRSRTYLFEKPQKVAAILQRNGTDRFVLTNGPALSWWEWSDDDEHWKTLSETRQPGDRRILRLHKLSQPITARYLRLQFAGGTAVGEAIFDSAPGWEELERWVLIVNSTHDRTVPGHGREFMPLVNSIPGWERTRGQQIWVGQLDRALAEADPKPVAIFFSGSFKDWCEVDRQDWKGVEELLKNPAAPMWASCGGAQALAILAENGTSKPWDCPHCRDARAPKLPIYTHIGHTESGKPCGDYSGCIFERGPHNVRLTGKDPVFAGLPEEFKVMESHCGQIAWPPRNWELVATAGEGSLTRVQCIKRNDWPIYAAQFHIEMDGTPASSQMIMSNFLKEAELWQKQRKDR